MVLKIYFRLCDTTSKVETKYSALRAAAVKNVHSLLNLFGKYNLTQELIYRAEIFFIQYILKDSLLDSFDEICVKKCFTNVRRNLILRNSCRLQIR